MSKMDNRPVGLFDSGAGGLKRLARRTRTGTVALRSTIATAESDYLDGLIGSFAGGPPSIEMAGLVGVGNEDGDESGGGRVAERRA